jgi:hypothetical protein
LGWIPRNLLARAQIKHGGEILTALLTYSSSKIEKSNNTDLGYLTAIMYLAPASLAGVNVCNHSSIGCRFVCLNTAGRGRFDNVQQARIRRTALFFYNRSEYDAQLEKEIFAHVRKAKRLNLIPAVRLDGTSDIPFERVPFLDSVNVMAHFPDVTFYDYTKYPYTARPSSKLPSNYHLTFSRSETTTDNDIAENLANERNVAVVFHKVPASYHGVPVIDGDTHDMRFLDKSGVIVGLKAKGKAKKDRSGFVV